MAIQKITETAEANIVKDDASVLITQMEAGETGGTQESLRRVGVKEFAEGINEHLPNEQKVIPKLLIGVNFNSKGGNDKASYNAHCVASEDYFPVDGLKAVKYNNAAYIGYQARYATYDANKEYISDSGWLRDSGQQLGEPGGYTFPENAAYFRISLKPRNGTAAATQETVEAVRCRFIYLWTQNVGGDGNNGGPASREEIEKAVNKYLTENPVSGLDKTELLDYLTRNNYAKTDEIPSKLSDLEADSTHRTVTDAEKSKWNDAANKIAAIETDTEEVEETPTMLINTGFTSGGNNNTGSDALHCVVTEDYFPTATLVGVRYNSTGTDGYQVKYCAYDSGRTMISQSGWLRDASAQFGVDGGYTFPENAAYFRASFKPKSGTAAATEETPGKIACVFTFMKQTAKEDLPGYYESPIRAAIDNIRNAQMEYGSHGIAFAFVTDMHQTRYKASNAGHAGEIIRRVAAETGIGFVLNGGDNINEGSKDEMTADIDNIRANLARAGLPVLNAIGNHDSNTPGDIGNYTSSEIQEMRFNREEMFALFFRDDIHRMRFVSDADCTWVYDDPTRKTRVIGFDTGNGSDIIPDYNALTAALKSTPEGWAIILTAHLIRNESAVSGIGSKVFSIVDSYNAKAGTVTVNGAALDFSDGCRGHVHLIVAGHTHFDSSNTTPGGVPVVICDCDSGNRTHAAEGAEIGTITEGCVSFLTVDYQSGNVNCFRVGRGEDRVFTSTVGVPGWSIENNSVAVTESQFFESITETRQKLEKALTTDDYAVYSDTKAGTAKKALPVSLQHTAVLYGLSKAAGVDLAGRTDVGIGIYPTDAKEAIQRMLGILSSEGVEF